MKKTNERSNKRLKHCIKYRIIMREYKYWGKLRCDTLTALINRSIFLNRKFISPHIQINKSKDMKYWTYEMHNTRSYKGNSKKTAQNTLNKKLLKSMNASNGRPQTLLWNPTPSFTYKTALNLKIDRSERYSHLNAICASKTSFPSCRIENGAQTTHRRPLRFENFRWQFFFH